MSEETQVVEQPEATEPTQETQEVKETTEVKEPEIASDKFEALARKEKAIFKARKEISQMKSDFERERAMLQDKIKEFERIQKLRDNAKLDPDAYLKEAGLSYGYLTEHNMKGGVDPNTILEKTQATLTEWEKRQEEKLAQQQKEAQERQQKEYEEQYAEFVEKSLEYIASNTEEFELVNQLGQQNLVIEVMTEAGRRGKALTVKEAALKVEDYLNQNIEKALSTKKFQGKFKKEEPKVTSDTTLNNAMSGGSSPNQRYVSEQERIDRALAVLNKFD